ncbi:uncharacterized protein CCOS01_13213 [Colletotrichum costaricense]|uniref:Uncharacterized protein n=1 Tax=Colletotrichum costaricense TaxID=1209916 RepID=A0AAI9YKY5_9PEZI|nr:uncharacterized protein CCOS01_13213 [Colletotrichum costaricense]KAK1515020.1 hypothetical protein CCOS01_13213 [Colletotrichum costaricense]
MESHSILHAEELYDRLLSLEGATVQKTSLTQISPLSRVVRTMIVIFELTTKTLARELKIEYSVEYDLELRSLEGSLARLKRCHNDYQCSDGHSELPHEWHTARFNVLSGIAYELMCWLNMEQRPGELKQVKPLVRFLKRHRKGPDDSAKDQYTEKAEDEKDNETLELMQEAKSNGGDSTIYGLIRDAREWGYNHGFLAIESDAAHEDFNIRVTNLAAYTISLEFLQFKRIKDEGSEKALSRMLNKLREGKLEREDAKLLKEHEAAIVNGAWYAAPNPLSSEDKEGTKVIDEESQRIRDRTIREIFGRVGKIFAAVGHDLYEPERHDVGEGEIEA